MHFRQTIRDALKARATALPGMSSLPVESIAQAEAHQKLPVAAVTLKEEQNGERVDEADGSVSSPRTLKASIVLVSENPLDLEKMAEQLEIRMVPDLEAGVQTRFIGTRFQDPARGERDLFSCALDFEFTYSLPVSDPSRVTA